MGPVYTSAPGVTVAKIKRFGGSYGTADILFPWLLLQTKQPCTLYTLLGNILQL